MASIDRRLDRLERKGHRLRCLGAHQPAIELTPHLRWVRLEAILADVEAGRRPARDLEGLTAILAPALERHQAVLDKERRGGVTMALRRRLERLEQAEGTADNGPKMLVYLEPGKWFSRDDGRWVPWPKDKAVPTACKVYGFFPTNSPEGIRRHEPA